MGEFNRNHGKLIRVLRKNACNFIKTRYTMKNPCTGGTFHSEQQESIPLSFWKALESLIDRCVVQTVATLRNHHPSKADKMLQRFSRRGEMNDFHANIVIFDLMNYCFLWAWSDAMYRKCLEIWKINRRARAISVV